MARLQKTTNEHRKLGRIRAHDHHTQRVTKGSFFWKPLEMLLAMGVGMALFYLLVLLIHASSSYGTMFEPGTDLYSIGMAVFMTVPTWLVAQCGNGGRNARASNGC